MVTVRWPAGTVACLASGPSLTQADADLVRGRVDGVIAINDAVQLAPWADVLYSSDPRWWKRFHKSGQGFAGQKVAVEANRKNRRDDYPWPDVTVLRNTGMDGLEVDPSGVKTYWNSGGAAINLAMHLGAAKVLLVGYDMAGAAGGRHHFHDERSSGSPYTDFRKYMATMVAPLSRQGVQVLNCSRRTRLDCFTRVPLETALEIEAVA